jgi:HAD superfamily hydrolase (TIGR01484 family)
LSFDFDGTLHDPAMDPPIDRQFFETLRRLRESHGALWGINTGRTMEYLAHGFMDGAFPFLPDYAVVCEREIFFPDETGRFVGAEDWNPRCAAEVEEVFAKAHQALHEVREHIRNHTGAQWMEEEGGSIGIISRTSEEMDWIVSEVTRMTREYRDLGWQRSTIYLRFGHKQYQKGSALAEVARLHKLTPAQVFAIGDSHNDLEMLDTGIAHHIACPANAVPDVRRHVGQQNGYQCQREHSHGVIEALDHFFAGTPPTPPSAPS